VHGRRLLFVAPLIGVFLFAFAGAASGVGQVQVSNATPAPGSRIVVISTGWTPGSEVTIALSGTKRALGRTVANASGNVRVRVTVPSRVELDLNVLSVNGTAASGVPQQVVTALSVHRRGHTPAPTRPWGLILALAAIAGAMLIFAGLDAKPATRFAAG
jgi:hypothetical protein